MKNYQDIVLKLQQNIARFELSDVLMIDSTERHAYTYQDIYNAANKIGIYLQKNNILEAVVCAENGVELFIFYFAAMFFNVTVIPVDPEKGNEEIQRIKKLHTNAYFFTESEIREILLGLQEVLDRKGIEDVDFEKTYLITYTSGSTGLPKGVKHSVANLFLSAYEFGKMMEYDEKVVMSHVMPMTYMAGILNTIFLPYIMGGKIVLMPRFTMKSAFLFWKTIAENDVNTFWLSPMMLRILDMLDRDGSMKSYLHKVGAKISIGTAPLDNVLRMRIEEKYNLKIFQSYGLSETLFISTETLETVKAGNSVGKLLQGVKIDFAEDGEILIDVPWMFQGYLNDNDIVKSNIYHSGDIGEIINEQLYIIARKKDLIIRGGFNINPRDIENILMEKGFVDECKVFSLDIKGEENIICCYSGQKDQEISKLNIVVQNILGKKYQLDILEKMSTIPKNLNGKIDSNKLKYLMEQKYDCKD